MQELLVVSLQLEWNGEVRMRHSYFPLIATGPNFLVIDRLNGQFPFIVEAEIKLSILGEPAYSEFYVRTDRGTFWGFEAKVYLLVEEHDPDLIQEWEHKLCEIAMDELRSRNKRLKSVFKVIEGLNISA